MHRVEGGAHTVEIDVAYSLVKQVERADEGLVLVSEEVSGVVRGVIEYRLTVDTVPVVERAYGRRGRCLEFLLEGATCVSHLLYFDTLELLYLLYLHSKRRDKIKHCEAVFLTDLHI